MSNAAAWKSMAHFIEDDSHGKAGHTSHDHPHGTDMHQHGMASIVKHFGDDDNDDHVIPFY
jgi:hypothetical protein